MRARNLAVACLLLAGCNSFNNWQFYPDQRAILLPIEAERARRDFGAEAVVSVPTEAGLQCQVYTFPELPAVPPLPLTQLARVPANSEAIDAIQQKHIEDLRKYIATTRKLIRLSYDKYIEECRAKNHVPAK